VAPLVVGFDLDLTLVDSRPGIAATFRALSERTGVFIDADAAVTRLGPPLDVELGLWFPAEEIEPAADEFRRLYPTTAITTSPALPGAVDVFAAVRDRGGRIVVITGKYAPNAHLHLEHLGLEADQIVGWAWAQGKVDAMLEHGVRVYLGDHPADMTAARAVPAAAIGVLTGAHTIGELHAAGAHAVFPDLTSFPRWLDESDINGDLGWVGSGGSLAL
jgi:phosphoglycolate phosphatase